MTANVSDAVSVQDPLLRHGVKETAQRAHTQRVVSFARTLPAGTSPDEADALIRKHIANLNA